MLCLIHMLYVLVHSFDYWWEDGQTDWMTDLLGPACPYTPGQGLPGPTPLPTTNLYPMKDCLIYLGWTISLPPCISVWLPAIVYDIPSCAVPVLYSAMYMYLCQCLTAIYLCMPLCLWHATYNPPVCHLITVYIMPFMCVYYVSPNVVAIYQWCEKEQIRRNHSFAKLILFFFVSSNGLE